MKRQWGTYTKKFWPRWNGSSWALLQRPNLFYTIDIIYLLFFYPYIIFTISVYTGFQKSFQKQNSGVRSNFKRFKQQYLFSTETEFHAVKNWYQWKVATNTSHILYQHLTLWLCENTLMFRCVKEMSQGRRFFYAPKRVFYKDGGFFCA